LKPERFKLKAVLTYHVVAGKFDAETVIDAINKITENIVLQLFKEGPRIKFERRKVMLTDANGGTATVILLM
jgi:uncharacterized surface protein with fasciclin (FAS1) repeats